MTLRQLVDATEILLDDLYGHGWTAQMLDMSPDLTAGQLADEDAAAAEDPEQVSDRRRANLIRTYGPGVIG